MSQIVITSPASSSLPTLEEDVGSRLSSSRTWDVDTNLLNKRIPMLGDKDINKIINAVKEYNDLLQKSSVVMDRLAETKKQWDILLSDRDELRAESERMNRFIAQFKEDYQNFHARESQWVNSVADLHTKLQFMVDELNTIVSHHRRNSVEGNGVLH